MLPHGDRVCRSARYRDIAEHTGWTNTVVPLPLFTVRGSSTVLSRSQADGVYHSFCPLTPWDPTFVTSIPPVLHANFRLSAQDMGHVVDWGKFCPVCRNWTCDSGSRPRDHRYPGGHLQTCDNSLCVGCTDAERGESESDGEGGRRIKDGDGHFSETEYPNPSDIEDSDSPRLHGAGAYMGGAGPSSDSS